MRWSVDAEGGGSEGSAVRAAEPGARSDPPPRARSPKAPSAAAKVAAAVMRTRWVIGLRLARGGVVGRLGALELRVEPAVRCRHVRERVPERDVVGIHAVSEGQLVALEEATDHAERDVGDVIRQAPPVREALRVAGQHAESVRRGVRRRAEVDLQRVRRRSLRGDLGQARDAGQQRLHDVRAIRLGTFRPGYRMLMTFASSGESTYLPKFFRSFEGCVALKKSFFPSGMTTSFTSGLPRRLTWTSCLRARFLTTLTAVRSVEDHTPTTALAADASATALPSRVTSDSGTCSVIVWTL